MCVGVHQLAFSSGKMNLSIETDNLYQHTQGRLPALGSIVLINKKLHKFLRLCVLLPYALATEVVKKRIQDNRSSPS